jgi:hypothetical protein
MNRDSKFATLPCLFLVASVVLLAVGCTPSVAPPATTSVGSRTEITTTAAPVDDSVQMVSLRVPTMHCPFACWPKVKETLEQQEGVSEVTLAKQAKENELDNPVVHLQVASAFDSAEAIEALESVGFADAVVE